MQCSRGGAGPLPGRTKVYGDRYGGEWPREQFRKHGVNYEPSEKTKSDLYRDLLPLINSGAVDLLEHDRERRTARGGKDSIDHAPGAHDDIANAVAGACQQEPYKIPLTRFPSQNS